MISIYSLSLNSTFILFCLCQYILDSQYLHLPQGDISVDIASNIIFNFKYKNKYISSS